MNGRNFNYLNFKSKNNSEETQELEFKYLIFYIRDEAFAIEVSSIHEIKSLNSVEIQATDKAPPFIRGLIALQDYIVTILDLRLLFFTDYKTTDEYAVIIFVRLKGKILGIVVDSVSKIISLKANDIKPTPDFYNKIYGEQMLGVIHSEGKLIILLDINNLNVYEKQ